MSEMQKLLDVQETFGRGSKYADMSKCGVSKYATPAAIVLGYLRLPIAGHRKFCREKSCSSAGPPASPSLDRIKICCEK